MNKYAYAYFGYIYLFTWKKSFCRPETGKYDIALCIDINIINLMKTTLSQEILWNVVTYVCIFISKFLSISLLRNGPGILFSMKINKLTYLGHYSWA